MNSIFVTTTTNPTGIRELPRSSVEVELERRQGYSLVRLSRLSIAEYSLPPESQLILIVMSPSAVVRLPLGTVSAPSMEPQRVAESDCHGVVRFRLLVRAPDSPRLIASAEKLTPYGFNRLASLIPIESTPLKQLVWRLEFEEADGDRPVLLCNIEVYPTPESAVRDPIFCSLVLPEVLRQVLVRLLQIRESAKIDPDHEYWSDVCAWLKSAFFEEVPERYDSGWIDRVVQEFCRSHEFVDKVGKAVRGTP